MASSYSVTGSPPEALGAITSPPPPSSFTVNTSSPLRLDRNGEQILFEGECQEDGLTGHICFNYLIASAISGCICVYLPLGYYCGRQAASSWTLYLTQWAR